MGLEMEGLGPEQGVRRGFSGAQWPPPPCWGRGQVPGYWRKSPMVKSKLALSPLRMYSPQPQPWYCHRRGAQTKATAVGAQLGSRHGRGGLATGSAPGCSWCTACCECQERLPPPAQMLLQVWAALVPYCQVLCLATAVLPTEMEAHLHQEARGSRVVAQLRPGHTSGWLWEAHQHIQSFSPYSLLFFGSRQACAHFLQTESRLPIVFLLFPLALQPVFLLFNPMVGVPDTWFTLLTPKGGSPSV